MTTCQVCSTGHRTIAEAQACGKPPAAAEPVVMSWDCREQPDLDQLAETIRTMSGGTVHLHQVDTGAQWYAIVLAPGEVDDQAVAGVYERWSKATRARTDPWACSSSRPTPTGTCT